MQKIKVATDFSGIGSPEQALKNLKIPHEVIFACDIDKYAKQTYLANHSCKTFYDDITTRNHSEVEKLGLYCAGFPCQAFSIAGKRLGFEETRGTLFFNVAEFIKINQPDVFILENVKGLLSHDGGRTFQTITDLLSNCGGTLNGQTSFDFFEDGLGYHVYYQVMNTKEHGIPQNRERVFIVGFKNYREFSFPKKEELKTKLKDLLEKEVDDKYFLSEKAIKSILLNDSNLQKSKINPDIANTLQSPGNACGTYKGMTAIKISSATKKGYKKKQNVRRLTPLECFRLQGFPDEFIKPCSDSQTYKQAGNTISINVIQKIINNIYNV
jgi:DNA (cytosine-5)-methyltransferase 1